MATYSIGVTAQTTASQVILKNSVSNDNCDQIQNILIKAGASEIRHVSITSTGSGANGFTVNETISADKAYSLLIDGFISASTNNNTITSTIKVIVRSNSSSGAIVGTLTFTRKHSSGIC